MTRGERIKKIRKERNFTQEQLAIESGLSTITIRQYENGKRTPQIEQLVKISEALKCGMIDLLSPHDFKDYLGAIKNADDINDWILKGMGYSFSDNEFKLVPLFNRLNDIGQIEAIRRINEMVRLAEYQRKIPIVPSAEDQEGNSSTPQEKPPEGQ